ncbi:MAG: NAD(P)/FAD-dependent oxidoreductase [Gammaproteobacteria bacterium]
MSAGNDNKTVSIRGAGPAGLAAALAAAGAGARGVVHEQRPLVGGRFHGDFQGLENWSTAGDVLEELAILGIEPDFHHTPVRELLLMDPDGRERLCRSERPLFYLVRRGAEAGSLDRALMDQALRQGVELRFRCTVDLDEMGGGIDASGPRGADTIALGYVFATDMADGFYAAVSDDLSWRGYAYLLVHDGRGTLASCLFGGFQRRGEYLARCVNFFQQRVGLRMRDARRFGGVGLARPPASARRGAVLRAGEAAGFQDALFGFGIRYALLSGHLAGYCIAVGRHGEYDTQWRRRFGGMLHSALFNRRLYEWGGHWAYRYLVWRVCVTRQPRQWLRRFYGSSWYKRTAARLLAGEGGK